MNNESTLFDETIQRHRESLVAELKRTIDDADGLLKEVSNSAPEELDTARQRIIAGLSDARARARDARIVVTRMPGDVAAATHEYIGANPWKVIGVAYLLGFVTALRLSRRSSK